MEFKKSLSFAKINPGVIRRWDNDNGAWAVLERSWRPRWETAQLTLGVAPEAEGPAGSLVCSYNIAASPFMKAHPFARAAVTQSHALGLDSRTSPARGSGGWKYGPRCGPGLGDAISCLCPHAVLSQCAVSVSKFSFLVRAPVILC